jgi:hypothetical protein
MTFRIRKPPVCYGSSSRNDKVRRVEDMTGSTPNVVIIDFIHRISLFTWFRGSFRVSFPVYSLFPLTIRRPFVRS